MPRNQKVKPQGFEDGAENDLKNKTKQNKKIKSNCVGSDGENGPWYQFHIFQSQICKC